MKNMECITAGLVHTRGRKRTGCEHKGDHENPKAPPQTNICGSSFWGRIWYPKLGPSYRI